MKINSSHPALDWKKALCLIICLWSFQSFSQTADQIMYDMEDDNMFNGGDIFSDFNEDVESSQALEDERFYRYGRFFSVNLGLGITTFTNTRGEAYDDNHPTFHLSVNYFLDFQKAILLGVEYSRHTMVIDTEVNASQGQGTLGAVNTDMTRVFTGFKYYLDTTDLGTAITYSNPYFVGRIEYWYQTNKFIDWEDDIPYQKGGGIGSAVGFGLEFPVELKSSYVNVEFLYHRVNFFDKYTNDYNRVWQRADDPDNPTGQDRWKPESKWGYKNLLGDVISMIISYNFTW